MYRRCVIIPQSIGYLLQGLALIAHGACKDGLILALLIATVADAREGYALAVYYGSRDMNTTKKVSYLLTSICRDTRIRTWDPLLPKQVR